MNYEYYNEYRKQVTYYIKDGRTLFTSSLREALELALRFKTYHYEMFNQENEFIGYGVPRK